jgi:hypothetical protein
MKQVQVIAGLEERLVLNRPVIQELLDQSSHIPPPLLGLDYLFEVLPPETELAKPEMPTPPLYHCALCTSNHSLHAVMKHFISSDHCLKFLKEFFPLAWVRFSSLRGQPVDWTEVDVEAYELVLNKIEAVHGRKRPSMVAGEERLEELVEKIPLPIEQYTSRRAELDAFFKELQPSPLQIGEEASPSHRTKSLRQATAVTVDSADILPGTSVSVLCRLLLSNSVNNTAIESLDARFVHISAPSRNNSSSDKTPGWDVRTGLSRVLVEDGIPFVRVIIMHGDTETVSPVHLRKNVELALVRWKS